MTPDDLESLSPTSRASSASTRSAARRRPVRATRPRRCRRPTCSPCSSRGTCATTGREPKRPDERPPHLLEGPRLATALFGLPRRRRGERGRAPHHLPTVRGPPAGPPDAGPPLGRPGDRLARPRRRRRRRCGAGRQAARPAPLPGLVALRRQRDSPRARSGRPSTRPPTSASPTSRRSSTSTGSASAARPSSDGTSTPTRRASSAFGCHPIEIDGHDLDAIDKAFAEAAESGPADGHPRPDDQGKGRPRDRGQERLARGRAPAGPRRARPSPRSAVRPRSSSPRPCPQRRAGDHPEPERGDRRCRAMR